MGGDVKGCMLNTGVGHSASTTYMYVVIHSWLYQKGLNTEVVGVEEEEVSPLGSDEPKTDSGDERSAREDVHGEI